MKQQGAWFFNCFEDGDRDSRHSLKPLGRVPPVDPSLIDLEPFRSKANPTIFLICLLGSKINDFYPGFSHFNFQRINPSSKISTLQHITRSIYMYNIYTYSIYVYSIHMFGNCNSDWHGLPSNWATNMNSSGGSNHMGPSILVVGSS